MKEQNNPAPRPRQKGLHSRWPVWIILGLVVLGLLWVLGPTLLEWGQAIMTFTSSEEAIESFVLWSGWFGPLVLITFHALQIVVAPIPAYALFGAAGFLYGPFWGGVYATTGTLLGITAAMLLTRRFGRPWAARMVGGARLDRWSQMTANRSLLLWGMLLLAPVGDIPFFLAGLAGVSILRIIALTLITRVPSIFLITTAASGTTSLGWGELAVMLVIFLIIFALMMRYQAVILAWFDTQVRARMTSAEAPSNGRVSEL
jgi:uncharacterized membrane protein YdjX (TVP38/TMEM64 family)